MSKNFNLNTLNNDEWLTPPEIIKSLGSFDLDPCSPIKRPWDTAKNHYSLNNNGLLQNWFGRIWLNPPYGRELEAWLNRMALHNNGIALVFARTETKAFQEYVFPYADSILFIKGRIQFYTITGIKQNNVNAPSLLIGYNEYNSDMISKSGINGFHISLNPDLFIIGIEIQENRSWKIIVDEALNILNKESTLSEIYDTVIKLAPKKIQKNKHFKEKIRQVLQLHFNNINKGIWSN